ncbi:MAG: hypothetical protein AUJ07_02045 [Crenarchaeota archaeon 13_1_40CM_3_53_5]|nr:MAG: hypothetical protein AUJ07_02045 [Crenarchaeota archaeon 13_1_40CM_3_53_5]
MRELANSLVGSRAIVVLLVATGVVFGYSTGQFPPIPDVNLPVLYSLARWDSGYYMGIARLGYGAFADNRAYAFLPGFPLILRLLYPLFFWLDIAPAEVMAGFVWNLVAVALASVYLAKLTRLILGPDVANRTLALLAVYPSTFFLSAIYPEATALLLIVASLYYLEGGKPLVAAPLGFLAGLVRPESFLFSVPIFVKALSEKRKLRMLLASIIVFLSAPAFAIFSYYTTGNLFTTLQVTRAWPICSVFCFANNPIFNLPFMINLVSISLAILFVVYSLVRPNASTRMFPYYLWALITIAIVFYVGEMRSWSRFMLVLPPVIWAQAEYSLTHPRLFQGLIISYAVMMCLATILFVNWYPML